MREPMVRVDIMCTSDGRLVVNEFESLDANYSGYGGIPGAGNG